METPCQPVVAETPPQVQRLGAIGLRGGVVRGSARSLAAVRLVGGVIQIALLRPVFPGFPGVVLKDVLMVGRSQIRPLVLACARPDRAPDKCARERPTAALGSRNHVSETAAAGGS